MKIEKLGNNWSHVRGVWTVGYAFAPSGQLLEGDGFSAYIAGVVEASADPASALKRTLGALNGLFSVLIDKGEARFLAVDYTRTFPLYYRLEDVDNGQRELLVADSPYVLRRMGADKLGEMALVEYDSAGAVSQYGSLVGNIGQIGAGCVVHELDIKNNKTEADLSRFFSLGVRKEEIISRNDAEFLPLMERVFHRLVESVHGRQLVIPLSGGFDSRLIATMLKRVGYKHVLCYTIGSNDSPEVEVAREVTTKLNLPFLQIDTTNAELAPPELVLSDDFRCYYRFLGGYSNFLWLYEYFAVRYLKNNRLIAEDAVFVPGHSGDFFAGSHLIKGQVGKNDSAKQIAETILRHNNEYGFRNELMADLVSWVRTEIHSKGLLPYSVYQDYIFKNRQACQIVNAARAYHHFGHEFRLPLFDREFVCFFKFLPYNDLRRKEYFNRVVMRKVFSPMGVDFGSEEAVADAAIRRQWLKESIKAYLPKCLVTLLPKKRGTDGEFELVQPLLNELVKNRVYAGREDFLSVNRTIRDWYLMKVRQDLAEKDETI